jgi:hypothetical protein
VYDDRPGKAEKFWFEVPGNTPFLSLSGNPWLAACCLA